MDDRCWDALVAELVSWGLEIERSVRPREVELRRRDGVRFMFMAMGDAVTILLWAVPSGRGGLPDRRSLKVGLADPGSLGAMAGFLRSAGGSDGLAGGDNRGVVG